MLDNEDFYPDNYEAIVNPLKQKQVVLILDKTLQFLRKLGTHVEMGDTGGGYKGVYDCVVYREEIQTIQEREHWELCRLEPKGTIKKDVQYRLR